MRTIIAGSRTIKDETILPKLIPTLPWNISLVISGNASGADTLGEIWAYNNKIEIEYYRPDWRPGGRYDPAAGFKRNKIMAINGEALILLWDGQSNGSRNMLEYSKKYKLLIHVEIVPNIDEKIKRELVRGMEE